MASDHGLRGLVRSTTFVQGTFHAPQQQQQRTAAQNEFKQEDFGDLLGHNRNPNMAMMIRQRKPARDKPDDPQEHQSQKLSVKQQADGFHGGAASSSMKDPNTAAVRKDHVDARGMPLLLAQKARRRGKDNRNHSKQARQVSFQAEIKLMLEGSCNPDNAVQMRKEMKEKFSKAALRLAMVRKLMPVFDPRKYPRGRISQAMLQHSGSDWMSRTLLMHTYVSVVQAIVRGILVRNWFRASLVEASARIADRDYFKRLASIGACTRSNAADAGDILAQQVREEEEEDAMDVVRRNRRAGDVSLDYEELKIVGHRFTRLGKAKAASGHAYQEMTKHVIVSGQTRRRAKVTLVTDTVFVPPCVHYNPFQQKTFLTAERMAHHMRTASMGKTKTKPRPPGVVTEVWTAHKQDTQNFIRSVCPPSTESSLSDWTDCDEEEFENIAVRPLPAVNIRRPAVRWSRHAHANMRQELQVKPAPAYQIDDEQIMVGEQQVLQHGMYMGRCRATKPTDRRMDLLERRVHNIRLKYEEPFEPATMDLPGDLVRDMLMLRLAQKQDQLGVPIHMAMVPHRSV